MAVEGPESGMKGEVKDLRRERVGRRPRVVVEYEANGRAGSSYFTWGVKEGVRAGVKLNDGVKATLTGDELIKGKKKVTLTARHLLVLARYKGIGWDILWWYAKVMRE